LRPGVSVAAEDDTSLMVDNDDELISDNKVIRKPDAHVAIGDKDLHTLATRGRNWGFREEALETV
jgi:hypothetical protein